MHDKTARSLWDPVEGPLSTEKMNERIWYAVHQRVWQEAMSIVKEKKIRFEDLNIAEVGCGTGTMALTFALLGSKVTLIDFNEKTLANAKAVYGRYGCSATFICADCLELLPDGLKGVFDIAMSFGLAEHFTGPNRGKCISYHYALIREGGFAIIHVPNKSSVLYRIGRFAREATGRWSIDVESAFTPAELKRMACASGFSDAYIIGYVGFGTDVWDYLGWVWSFLLKRSLIKRPPSTFLTAEDARELCKNMAVSAKIRERDALSDRYCSNIDLFALK